MLATPTRHRDLLLTYLQPQRLKVALLTILLLSSIGLQLVNPQILRAFIDTATGANGQPSPLSTLLILAGVFMGVALLTQIIAVAATYLSEQVGWTATNLLRSQLARHCLRLDMPFHHLKTPGELIERIDGDVTALSTFFSQLVIQVLGSGMLLAGVLVLLFLEDWRVGLALSSFALVALLILIRSRNLAVEAMAADREAHATLYGFIEERLAGLDDLRANGGGSYVMRRMAEAMRNVARNGRRAVMRGSAIWMITIGLFTLGYALALGMGAYLYNAGAISLGTVYLFFQYTEMLRRPLENISEQLKEFQRASASIGRISEIMRLDSTIKDGPGAQIGDGPLGVEFDHVTFGYDDNTVTINDLALRLEPGHVLGLLGRTGSGKTTLTRLLLRLYDINAGAIRLNGIDIRTLKQAELRRRIGIVTQDVQLFQASIRDNLTLFDATISDERIVAVLSDLGLDAWYEALPHGLNTELSANGGGLSAGEAQLVAFARVFLKDPGLVILDEASSRLDPATERLIERAINTLLANRTGIIIAHRLDTVQRADEILILERGASIEYGSRAQLAADPQSRFAELTRTGMDDMLA